MSCRRPRQGGLAEASACAFDQSDPTDDSTSRPYLKPLAMKKRYLVRVPIRGYRLHLVEAESAKDAERKVHFGGGKQIDLLLKRCGDPRATPDKNPS